MGRDGKEIEVQGVASVSRKGGFYTRYTEAQSLGAIRGGHGDLVVISLPVSLPLQGRVALVTGAAKRLGRAVALRLAEEGADLVVHYRSSQGEAQDVVKKIEKLGRRASAIAADLSSVAEIKRLFDEAGKRFGRLDILVNSAANFLPANMVSTTEEIWDSALDTNLRAPFFCAQAAAPWLRRTQGVIINFADSSGLLGWPGYIPHSVSKAGVIMLTKVLAKALAPEVRVNAIVPGTITMEGDPQEWEADFVKLAPLRRTGKPNDIADAVSYLIRAEFMTGHVLVLDGGRSLGPTAVEFR
ncbi:MAG: short-chain dehydrogenase [Acidobacteria bacterium]|nr:MAG: short-chain dehydrogenase [Acidobacteriota bacterium]